MASNTNFKEYHSFGGVDIHAVFGDRVFGELQMVSYRADREKAPVFTMGSANPRSIARGKRIISGACVFVIFDRDSLLASMDEQGLGEVYLDHHETANYARGGLKSGTYQDGITSAGRTAAANGGTVRGYPTSIDIEKLNTTESIRNTLRTKASARLADQVLPFDITLVGSNEYGHTTKMVIYGVELMTEAGGVSVDDMVIDKQMSFLARSISNWMAIDQDNTGTVGIQSTASAGGVDPNSARRERNRFVNNS